MLKRKSVLGAAAIAAVASGVAAASLPANAAESVNLTFITGFPPGVTAIGAFIDFYAPAVNAQLAKTGKYTVNWNLAHSGQIVKPRGELEGVELGLGDISVVPSVFHADKLPLYELSFKTPFTTKNMDLIARTFKSLEGKYSEAFEKGWKASNQVELYPTGAVDNYFVLSPKPLAKFADLKGLKLGAAGPNLPWVTAAGAAGVQTNLADAYNSLSTGIYEGGIFWAQAAGAFKLCEPAPFIFDTGFGANQAQALTVNTDVFNALPDEVRTALVDNAEGWHAANVKKLDAGAKFGINRCQTEFNTKVTTMSDDDRRQWALGLGNLAKDWATKND
nr:hypothetical protein [Alphaproteobacteria bacterium]